MDIFGNIYKFFTMLNTVDIVFLLAVILLIILVVTLIHFIKSNKEVLTEDDFFKDFTPHIDNINKEEVKVEEVKSNEEDNTFEDAEEDIPLLDLKGLEEKLKNEKDDSIIKATEYEKDQEEKAIISYDELLKNHNKYAINYEKEELMDDLVVKKVNLNDLENKDVIEEEKEEVRVISYKKEEEFLKALKELNILLN